MKLPNTKLLKRATFVALSAGILSSSLLLKSLHAQTTTRTMTIVPPTVQQSLDPGKSTEGVMKVINDSDEPLTFTATIRDFIVEDKNGTPTILPPNSQSKKYSASAWIGVTPDTFTIEPHKKQTLNYYLQVPADAKPGGRYAAIVYEPAKSGNVNGSGAAVATQIGTLFYVIVNGPVTEQAKVSQFYVKPFNEYGPVQVTTEILNNSDLHIKPKGTITLKNTFGKAIETKQLPERNIFPEQSRIIQMLMGKHWMFGRYTLNLVATYGLQNNNPLTASVSFWVIPWKLLSIILLAIIAIVLLVIFLRTKKKGAQGEPPQQTT